MRKEKDGEKEKAKLLVLALLFKIRSSFNLKSASKTSLRELLTKAESLTAKYGIDSDESMRASLTNVKAALADTIENEEQLLDDYSFQQIVPQPSPKGSLSRKTSPAFKSKAVVQQQDRQMLRNKNFVIRGSSKSPQVMKRGTTPDKVSLPVRSVQHSPKILRQSTGGGSRERPPMKTPPIRTCTGKSISESLVISKDRTLPSVTKRHTDNLPSAKEMREKAINARRDFKEGIDNLLKLGDYVKKEIMELNDEPRLSIVRIKKKGNQEVIEESDEEMSDTLDKEISNKIGLLYDQQLEWEKQRELFVQKLEKLEKKIEIQTTFDDLTSQNYLKTPKSSMEGASPMHISQGVGKRSFLTPKAKPEPKIIIGQATSENNHRIKNSQSSKSNPVSEVAPSMMSGMSRSTSKVLASEDSLKRTIKYAILQFEKGIADFEDEYRQIISCSKDRNLVIGFKGIKSAEPKGKPMIVISLYATDSDLMEYFTPLDLKLKQQDFLTLEDLEFILMSLKTDEVLPSHLPITAFTSLKFILVKILGKFIHVKENSDTGELDGLAVRKIPRSLLADEKLVCSFFNQDSSVTLLHMHGSTFRMVLRDVHEPEAAGFCAEVVFNDFVMHNFFQVCSRQFAQYQKVLWSDHQPTAKELASIQRHTETAIRCVWLQPTPEKKVIPSHQAKVLAVVKALVVCLETHLRSRELSPQNLAGKSCMFLLQLVDWKKEQFTVFEVVEESPEASDFTIRARNNFMSYSNRMPQ